MSMMRPPALISVVIPVYNVETYLAQCLESVAAQSYGDLEILCVIDGSTDGSAEIAWQFARREPRCRVLEQRNQGLSVARNTGVAEARGQWVFFLDSDDWLPEHALQALIRAADDAQPVVVSGAVMEYWEESGTHKPYQKPEKRATGHLHLYRQDFFALETMAWNKLYPREWVCACPFIPGLVHEDLDFYWRFFSAHPKVVAIPDTVIHYRRRPGTLSRQMAYDGGYQDHYIHIVDTAFTAAHVHPSLRYHARRQSLKYLKYLRQKHAPWERYAEHIGRQYGVRDTSAYRFSLKLKKLLKI
jgi:glycosyltransferase involved in cell wall biosynthesis